jgi:ribosomal protein S18 acetylase RimI-like enzyme
MLLRTATSQDAPRIAALHASSWRNAYRGALSEAYLTGDIEGDRLAVWRKRLDRPVDNQRVAVALDDDALIGFACWYLNDDAHWGSMLDNIHVSQQHQGRGAGKLLMGAVAQSCAATALGCGFYLWVIQSNARALRFYHALGGKTVGEDIWAPPGGGSVPRFRIAWTSDQLGSLADP